MLTTENKLRKIIKNVIIESLSANRVIKEKNLSSVKNQLKNCIILFLQDSQEIIDNEKKNMQFEKVTENFIDMINNFEKLKELDLDEFEKKISNQKFKDTLNFSFNNFLKIQKVFGFDEIESAYPDISKTKDLFEYLKNL